MGRGRGRGVAFPPGQAHRTPEPQQQLAGGRQFAQTPLQHQAGEGSGRWREQLEAEQALRLDLLEAAEQQPLTETQTQS